MTTQNPQSGPAAGGPEPMAPAPVGWSAAVTDLSYSYGARDPRAIDGLTAEIRPGVITGLLGRNGSGKSTLAMLLAGQLRAESGRIRVDGRSPWEDPQAMAGVALVAADVLMYDDEPIAKTFDLWRDARPTWNGSLAELLLEKWRLDASRDRPAKLSTGQRSALAAILGLASGAPLTIYDEVHLGMDAVVRREFYDALLADYAQTGRTIILSSHLIEEVSDLLEDVALLDRGRLLDAGPADEVRARHAAPDAPDRLPDLTDVLIALTEEPRR